LSHRDSIANGIAFINAPGSGAATFAWDFGDGSTSTSANPSHTYAASGTYYVCLTVTDTVGGGCSNTSCDSVRVFTPQPHCNAHFNHWLDTVPNGVRFRSHGNSAGATYAWDFGDGSTSSDPNPNHAYAAAGHYYVCLTVSNTNAGGTCSDTHCDSVRAFTPQPHCNAHYIAIKDSMANGIRFHSGPTSPGATYAWDFGDGSTSADPNPNHTYAAAGTYYVCLIVSNSNAGGSCADTVCDSVNTAHPGHPHHWFKLGAENTSVSNAVVAIYPNPMVENATLHIENTSGNVTFRVFQINGQIVLNKIVGNGDYNLSKDNLTEGMYFYTVEDGNTTVARGKFRVN
jgi:PKD repeat protein